MSTSPEEGVKEEQDPSESKAPHEQTFQQMQEWYAFERWGHQPSG